MKKNEFAKILNVSRETLNDFCEYEALLYKWNKKINLVSENTLVNIWERHFLDSGQIINHVETSGKRWIDVGSGAGFPGLVVALLLRDRKIHCDLVLVEKNQKKGFFLNEMIRKLNLRVEVVINNIDALKPLNADILTARAFSDLNTLIEIAFRHQKKEGVCLFLKGKNYRLELDKTLNFWFFNYDVVESLSSSSGKIIRVKKISKR